MLIALSDFKLAAAAQSIGPLEEVVSELQSWRDQLPANDQTVVELLEKLVSTLIHLCKWVQHSLSGDLQPERFLNAAKGHASIAEESLSQAGFPLFANNARQVINTIKAVDQLDDVKAVVASIGRLSIPILYLKEDRARWGITRPTEDEPAPVDPKSEGPFVIKVMFDIERQPWSNQQVLLTETLYDLHAKITIPIWPTAADHLLIDYISTLSLEQYRITNLRIDRPKNDRPSEFECTGHIEFLTPQNFLSEPVVIRVRATFLSASGGIQGTPATIIGYHQLRARISDKAHRQMFSGYKAIDARIQEIVNEINQSIPIVSPGHLSDFVAALSAITNYMGINLQQALYKEGTDVSEAEFQNKLLYHLRLWLGEEVFEAPRQAGGPVDIRYRSVTIELKVEDKISDRRKMIEKYCAQPVQYSSGSGAQLGILCILDQTDKRNPPASPQNQISLETPPVHGYPQGDAPYPTKIAAVIIDGKLRLPSSYSR